MPRARQAPSKHALLRAPGVGQGRGRAVPREPSQLRDTPGPGSAPGKLLPTVWDVGPELCCADPAFSRRRRWNSADGKNEDRVRQHLRVRRSFSLIFSLNLGDNSEMSIKLLSRREEGELRPDGGLQAPPCLCPISLPPWTPFPRPPASSPSGFTCPGCPTWEHFSLPDAWRSLLSLLGSLEPGTAGAKSWP